MFDKLRITPEIVLAAHEATPGSILTGNVIVRSTAGEPVAVRDVWVEFSGVATVTFRVRRRVRREYFEPNGVVVRRARYETVSETRKTGLGSVSTPAVAEPTEFRAGVTTLPFTLPLPVDLPVTAGVHALRFYVEYKVSAKVRVSSLVHRHAEVDVRIVDSHGPASPPLITDATLLVGMWDAHSKRFWPAVRYYLGRNTTVCTHSVVVRAELLDIVLHPGTPAYLQDALRLTVESTVPNHEQLLVTSLVVTLRTEVRNPQNKAQHASDNKVLDSHNIDFPFNLSAPTDITALLSGALVPSSTLPTIAVPGAYVWHYLTVRLGLRSQSPDGTRQPAAHTKVSLCPRIRMLASGEPQWIPVDVPQNDYAGAESQWAPADGAPQNDYGAAYGEHADDEGEYGGEYGGEYAEYDGEYAEYAEPPPRDEYASEGKHDWAYAGK